MIYPILMSAPMVLAILAGRKTQTRRLWRGQWTKVQPGDRLWVRESGWQPKSDVTIRDLREGADTWPKWVYDADGPNDDDTDNFREWGWKRRPSIHMPRWASRLTLRVTKVRRQRLWDISERDCKAEGVRRFVRLAPKHEPERQYASRQWGIEDGRYVKPMAAFQAAWEALNATRAPWASNPEVAAISFEAVRENVDKAVKE